MTKSLRTSVLEVAYEEHGPREGTPVVLLHGFPDDAHSWDAVAGALAATGHRALAPYLRGFGPTRFLNRQTIRSGQNVAFAMDAIEFANALNLERFVLVGHNWGARAAQTVAALYPDRVTRLVTFLCYSLTWAAHVKLSPYAQIHALRYQSLLQSELGASILRADRRGFCRRLWEAWSPNWRFQDEEFEATATSFDNPDFIEVVLHAFRYGSPFGPSGADELEINGYQEMEARLSAGPPILVPTVVVQGTADGLLPDFSPLRDHEGSRFVDGYRYHLLQGVGHFPHRENPAAVVGAVTGEV